MDRTCTPGRCAAAWHYLQQQGAQPQPVPPHTPWRSTQTSNKPAHSLSPDQGAQARPPRPLHLPVSLARQLAERHALGVGQRRLREGKVGRRSRWVCLSNGCKGRHMVM